MTELEIMQRAKAYIDQLANGINPIDGTCVADSDVINNVRISRCLFYVSDILKRVIDNGGSIGKKKVAKGPFFLPSEAAKGFRFSKAPITVSEIVKHINSLADSERCCQLKLTSVTTWLIEIGALEVITTADGKNTKLPTAQGTELGILTEKRMGQRGEYTVVVYNIEAQRFIIDNIEAIIAVNAAGKKSVSSEIIP